jgi:demethylmenaquinone methyltransferase/2-methoxy-6-polyprenyl-1,4-benzoquinol methylase
MLDKRDNQIEAMFSRIVGKYDTLNAVMSLGMAGLWRRAAVKDARMSPGKTALDVCCGTGDLTFALSRTGGESSRVVGMDFSEAMLRKAISGAEKRANVSFTLGNALAIPFRSSSFDCVTAAFGLRNVSDIHKAICEMARVTAPGGHVVCLDIGRVETPVFAQIWRIWFAVISPILAALFGSDRMAYSYLVDSVSEFMPPTELADIFSDCSLVNVKCRRMAFGAVFTVSGTKASTTNA